MRSPSPTAAAYYCNGSICCLSFFIGTLGNIVSFFYFKSKKRDISNVIYMLITANDIVVSITVLPVGISFLSKGQPGIIFGNNYGCAAWEGIWKGAISISVFLVSCLCATRTVSLLKPFQRRKIRYLVFAVMAYLVINIALITIFHLYDGTVVTFSPEYSRCSLFVTFPIRDQKALYLLYGLVVKDNIFYTAPAFVVAASCAISVVVLTRRNRDVQQKELQQSRNRATVTILLFALLYGVCNMPYVVDSMVFSLSLFTNNLKIFFKFHQFDKHLYYWNTMATILPAANSAANPILYFWRMPALREYIMSGIRRMLGLNREVRRPTVHMTQQAEAHPVDTVVENINIAQQLTASRRRETELRI